MSVDGVDYFKCSICSEHHRSEEMMKSGNLEFVCFLLLTATIVMNGIVAQKNSFKPKLTFCYKLPDKCLQLVFEYWPEACNYSCSPTGEIKTSECNLWPGLLTDIPQCANLYCQPMSGKPAPTQSQQHEFRAQLDPDTYP